MWFEELIRIPTLRESVVCPAFSLTALTSKKWDIHSPIPVPTQRHSFSKDFFALFLFKQLSPQRPDLLRHLIMRELLGGDGLGWVSWDQDLEYFLIIKDNNMEKTITTFYRGKSRCKWCTNGQVPIAILHVGSWFSLGFLITIEIYQCLALAVLQEPLTFTHGSSMVMDNLYEFGFQPANFAETNGMHSAEFARNGWRRTFIQDCQAKCIGDLLLAKFNRQVANGVPMICFMISFMIWSGILTRAHLAHMLSSQLLPQEPNLLTSGQQFGFFFSHLRDELGAASVAFLGIFWS